MSIHRRSKGWTVAGWLAVAILLADVFAVAGWHPRAGAGLWADLARLCTTDGFPAAPAADHGGMCVFCLPLMGGGMVAPAEIAAPSPLAALAVQAASLMASVARAAPRGANTARGPPTLS